jgi:RNA polymerase sigma factor (sigma-70 family)
VEESARPWPDLLNVRNRGQPGKIGGWLARHRDVAAHHAGELAGNSEAQSGTAEPLGGRGIGLGELLEQLRLLLCRHTNPCIGDREVHPVVSVDQPSSFELDLALLGELASIAQRAAVTTWLLSIARFKALSARRRRTDAELGETIEATVADSTDDPEITLQKKSRNELVRQAMSNLSADHREILDLVYYQEKSIEDCALILGIPAATVKTRLFYARKKLAELVVGA